MNNSKYYYLSNENMSGIKQEIGQNSMNFQKQSYRPGGQSKQEISQMIGSMSHNSKPNSMSQRDNFRKPLIQNKTVEQNVSPPKKQNFSMPIQQQSKKPIYLGDTISKTIKQRYYQINKITTDDPDVLFDFYSSHRKTFNKNNNKDLQTAIEKIKDLMPTMQRKMLNKMQFENLLMYYPVDVQYTLYCDANSLQKDKELNKKVQIMNHQAKKNQGKKKLDMKKMIERLYGQTIVKKQTENQKDKRTKFGKNLSQHFQNAYRNSNPVQTVEKLHNYWDDCYERQQYGIQWDEETAKQTICLYMKEQIEGLFMHLDRKLGYRQEKNIETLWKFYKENPQLQNIYIPTNSFQQYFKVYSDFVREQKLQQQKRQEKVIRNSVIKQKKDQVKKFGRPVSATPLTILSKPKQSHAISEKMLLQFGNDQKIAHIAYQQRIKGARYPFQYGIYDIENEIKTKQRIKPNPKKQYDKTIEKALMSTFTKGFNNHSSMYEKQDRVNDILGQENLQSNENWKQLNPILSQALEVKAYEEKWFRDCLVRYAEKIFSTDMKLQPNKTIIKNIIKKFSDYSQQQRKSELQKFESLIAASQAIAQKTAKIQNLANDSQKQYQRNKKQCFFKLQNKAIEFIQLRRKHSYDESFSLREYLNDIFEKLLKDHKKFMKKYFHVVEGEKQCPKLLKYHFFRLIKEVNQFAMQRDNNAKSHAWIPTKSNPESFNYKTYNQFANHYTKNRNIIVAGKETDKHKTSIWGRQKRDQRQKLLMTYDDAKQCTFEPRFSKKTN